MIGNLEAILKEVEPQTKSCFVCGRAFQRSEMVLAKYKHQRMVESLGAVEARKLHRRLIKQYGKMKNCREKFLQRVQLNIVPLPVEATVGGRTIVARVCSEECRNRHASNERGYDECIVQLHSSWQQVKAIREFLKTGNLSALLSLPVGLRPDRSSLGS